MQPAEITVRRSDFRTAGGHPFLRLAALLACLWAAAPEAQGTGPQRKAFGKRSPFQAQELPEGRLKSGIQKLGPQAREKAMRWLHTFDFGGKDAADHLRVDAGGGIYIVCPDKQCDCADPAHHTRSPLAPTDSSGETDRIAPEAAPANLPAVGFASVSTSAPPAYHSKPNSTRRIYLDFNGATVSGTAWNTSAGVASWSVKAWSQDADLTTFNDAEQAWMKRVWQRVAEDYAPFDIDVTTDVAYDPDVYTGNKDNIGWLLICETTDNNGIALPHAGSGGIAYVGVFGDGAYSPSYQPAWVTSTNGGGDEAIIAEAASHEMGHNMGLSHDGTSTQSYYGGHGSGDISWGPLMGTGYNRNVSQWSAGEYYNANLFEDDLAVISTRVPYRSDDHGGTAGTAMALTVTGGTTITSTTPENDPTNSNPANKGVIERNTDVDVFSFYTGTGAVTLNAKPWIQAAGTRGGNLDILLELYDNAGVLVASSNAANLTTAAISTSLVQGYYYLHVRNTGTGTPLAASPSGYTSYGSLGQYFLSGTIVNATPPPALSGITPTSGLSATTVAVDISGLGISTSTAFKLSKAGQPDIIASSVTMAGTALRCEFNLAGAATGAWDVVATNPNLQSSTLTAAFTVIGVVWSENLDGGTVTGWTSDSNVSNSWSQSTGQSHSPTSSWFAAGPSSRSITNLTSPSIPIPPGATDLQLKFWHSYAFQSRRDGGRLELSINGGAWFGVDSANSGASFASNGYSNTIISSSSDFLNLSAWTGTSNGFSETVVNLTDTVKYAGKNIRFRWRLATNSGTSSIGWYIDSISLIGNGNLSNQPPVIASAPTSSSTETVTAPDTTIYQIIRGTSASLSAAATDDGGEPALTYSWSVTSGPGAAVGFSPNGSNTAKNTTASFMTSGDYRIAVSVEDAQGLTATREVNLRVVQTASALEISPAVASITVGTGQSFVTTLRDQFNIPIASQPSSVTWTTSGGGSIDAAGLFSATTAGGPYDITATSGGISNTASVTVTPGTAVVVLAGLQQTYSGAEKAVTATTLPAGLPVAIAYNASPDPPVNAGSYAIIATITSPNYQGSATGTLVIGKATAGIELTGLTQTYTGSPRPISAVTTPEGLALTITYNGSDIAPIETGSYPVSVNAEGPNHQGTANGILVIEAADPFQVWTNVYFSETEINQGLSEDVSDPDADGLANLAEYALGSDPRQFSQPLIMERDANGLTLTFTRPAGLPEILYAAESSDGLGIWSPVPLEVIGTGAIETIRARDPLTEGDTGRRFIRLRFERE